MKFLKIIDWADIAERTSKTFIETFLATIAATDFLGVADVKTLKSTVVSVVAAGVAAGLCAVWNTLVSSLKEARK